MSPFEFRTPCCQTRGSFTRVLVPYEHGRHRVRFVKGQEGARTLHRCRDRRRQRR